MTQTARAYVFLCLRSVLGAWGIVCVALCLLFVLCRPPDALASPPREIIMDPPMLVVENGMVVLRLALTVDNEEGLLALLKDGAVLELGVSMVIERERTLWRNARAAAVSFPSSLRHDPLSRDFIVPPCDLSAA